MHLTRFFDFRQIRRLAAAVMALVLAASLFLSMDSPGVVLARGYFITTVALQPGIVGTAYSQTLAVDGLMGNVSWTTTGGSLPPGLSLSPGGVISGTPTAGGKYSFTVEANDGYDEASEELAITVQSAGTVWAWGDNSAGDLGNGTSGYDTDSDIPVEVENSSGSGYLSGVVAVAAGVGHSLALKSDGTVWTWGSNFYGELGNGTSGYDTGSDIPVEVENSSASGYLSGVVTVAAGDAYCLALKSDGTVWAWGDNGSGELGNGESGYDTNGNDIYSDVPVEVENSSASGYLSGVVAIAAGSQHSLALKSDGTIWAWGDNSFGELGNGTTNNSAVPVEVEDDYELIYGATAIAAGGLHSLAIYEGDLVGAWGYNSNGQLGNGTIGNQSTVLVPVENSSASGYLGGVAAIAAGGSDNSLALKSDGTVWAWGENGNGQLGNGSSIYQSDVPVEVENSSGSGYLSGVAAIANSLALKSDGTVWAWGDNYFGELGNGTSGNQSDVPVEVSGLTGTIAVSAGGGFNLALDNSVISHFTVTGIPDTISAGTPSGIKVTAYNQNNRVMTEYTGTVHFNSTDSGSSTSLPADYTFTAADQGVHTFTGGVTLTTAGPQTVTVNDISNTSAEGTETATVAAGPLDHYIVSNISAPQAAGAPFNVTLQAQDRYDNNITIGNDSAEGVDISPGVADAGMTPTSVTTSGGTATVSLTLTKATAGQTLTFTGESSGKSVTSNSFTVGPGAASRLVVSGYPATTMAGEAHTLTVTVEDSYGNVDTDYSGTVRFSSSDSRAVLPVDSTLTDGTGSFSATLNTAGTQLITGTDTMDNNITGMQSGITVNPVPVVSSGSGVAENQSGGNYTPPSPVTVPVNLNGTQASLSLSTSLTAESTLNISSPDKKLGLIIPSGTVIELSGGAPASISITSQSSAPAPPHGEGFIGLPYSCQPDGLVFDTPINLVWNIGALPAGISPAEVEVGYYDQTNGDWVTVPASYDAETGDITATIFHFTDYDVLVPGGKTSASPAPAPATTAPPAVTAPFRSSTTAPPVSPTPAAPSSLSPAAPVPTTNWGLIIGIVVLVILIILVMLWLRRRRKTTTGS